MVVNSPLHCHLSYHYVKVMNVSNINILVSALSVVSVASAVVKIEQDKCEAKYYISGLCWTAFFSSVVIAKATPQLM